MTTPFRPRGAWTALVTPFTEQGKFDSAAYSRLIQFQLAEGIDGLVPCGTTGESPTLTWEEQGAALELAVRHAQPRQIGVLAGTGSNNTLEAIEGTRDAWLRGASAALLVDCYYNGPSSLELRTEYYERILEAVGDIPIVPYVIPGRTGCALAPEDLAVLHRQAPERVPAVKSATGDLGWMRRERELAGSTLSILSGDDVLTQRMMSDPKIAASGVVSVMANLVPRAVRDLCAACKHGENARAEELAGVLEPLFELVGVKAPGRREVPGVGMVQVEDRFRNPLPVKTMMAGLGMIGPSVRPPLGKMTAPAVAQCREALTRVYESAPQVLSPIEAAFGINISRQLADEQAWSALVR